MLSSLRSSGWSVQQMRGWLAEMEDIHVSGQTVRNWLGKRVPIDAKTPFRVEQPQGP